MKNTNNNKLNPNWVTGFVDAEGCFHVSIYRDKKKKTEKWHITPVFQVGLHIKDLDILINMKSFFNDRGNIYKYKNSANYQIRDLNSLYDIVIPHFDKYTLLTQKQSDYLLFKEIIYLKKENEHLNNEGLKNIVNIKSSINNGPSQDLISYFPEINPVPRPKVNITNLLLDYCWLAGFISGEGCFSIKILKTKDSKIGWRPLLELSITQHNKDEQLLLKFVDFLGCGSVYKHGENTVVFKVANFKDICTKIIPFLTKHNIHGIKYLDFVDFCTVSNIMINNLHLTREGFEEIRKIKLNMNKNRFIIGGII
jgi:hypothetical protein